MNQKKRDPCGVWRLFALAALCPVFVPAAEISRGGNFAVVKNGEIRVAISPQSTESVQRSGDLLFGPMFLHFVTAKWKDVGSEMAPLESKLEHAECRNGRAVLGSWCVIGKEGEGKWKVKRDVEIGPGTTMRVRYAVETLQKSNAAAYLYVSVRMKRQVYAKARIAVEAKTKTLYENGVAKRISRPGGGLFEGPFGGVFQRPRNLRIITSPVGAWSMSTKNMRGLGLHTWNWTCEAQWVASPTTQSLVLNFDFGPVGSALDEEKEAATGRRQATPGTAGSRAGADNQEKSGVRNVVLQRPARQISSAQRAEVCLNGDWEFLPGGTDELPSENAPWVRVHVPGWLRDLEYELPEEDFSPPYGWKSYGRWGRRAPRGWYRLHLHLPRGWNDDRRVTIEFEGVAGTSDFYLGGRHVAHSESREIPVAVPVPIGRPAPGGNETGKPLTLSVRVRQPDQRQVAGIWRDVFLRSRPRVEVENVFLMPSVRKKTLAARVWVRNTDARPHTVTVAPTVWRRDKRVLSLPQVAVKVLPGETREVTASAKWENPILWGFAPYGQPTLYTCSTELREQGRSLDVRADRFGFREFWTRGRDFYLNGKPIFLKGDLFPPSPDVTRNRWLMTLYYLAEREANINFIRFHSYFDFPYSPWLDVADEVGMLVEPQSYLRRDTPERFGLLKREWESFVRRNWNHPSVVMWSSDNEACSQASGLAPDAIFEMLDEVHSLIRELDPTRPIESQGNVQLGVAAKMGLFHHLEVFNAHPYGAPLGHALKQLLARYECPPDVPVHVGEIYYGSQDPFNWWTRPAEMLRRREAIAKSYDNCGRFYHDSILSVAQTGARGASLCAGMGNLFWGPTPEGGFRLGPWHDQAKVTDESFDKVVRGDGKIVGRAINTAFARIKWPSRSGRGARPDLCPVYIHTGYGYNLNFWDMHRPPFIKNLAHEWVRKAFEEVDGQATGPLARRRPPEVVLTVYHAGEPRAGVYVFARKPGSPRDQLAGVMTDRDGTAWMALPGPGEYEFSAEVDGKTYVRKAALESPPLNSRPGYSHLFWLDLGDPAAEKVKARLQEPTGFVIRDRVKKRVPGPEELKPPEVSPGPHFPDKDGFLRAFLVCGPFPNIGDREKGYEGLKTDWLSSRGGEASAEPAPGLTYPVSFPDGKYWTKGEAQVAWFGLRSDRPFFNLDRVLLPKRGIGISPPQDVVAYAACTILASRDEQLLLAIGSDDGHKVWLNGKVVGEDARHGAAKKDAHKYPVQLRRGENQVLLKIDQSFGGYGFYCRFLREETPVKDLSCFLVPHPLRYGPRPLTSGGGERPCFSPDGEKIVFNFFQGQDRKLGILSLSGTLGAGRAERETLCGGYAPAWSPRGGSIVFCRQEGGATNLWQIDLKTKQQTVLTRLKGQCRSPAFSPDGRSVYFAFRSQEARGLRALELSTGEVSVLTAGDEREPAPSPDGGRIAFIASSGGDASCLFVMDIRAGKRHQLTHGGGNQGGASAPAWSPSGKWIAHCRTSIQPYRNIIVISPDGKQTRPLTRDGKDNTHPCWAPDGERLVIVSRRGSGPREVWLVPAKNAR